ncbi:MAG: cephalosporin hydroxylase family protein [Planctomycetota bacterium]|nr:cephalosporin hydroxylase family protein [Planctomycetota bacterium]
MSAEPKWREMTPQGTVLEQYRKAFLNDLFINTDNFGKLKWLGYPIWQNVLDLWTIQETLAEIKPAILIECGTFQGGSAIFYAHLFDLMNHGRVVSIDNEKRHSLTHPRVEFLIGSSISQPIVEQINARVAAADGPVMVILDSDHTAQHVFREMLAYAPMVTPGSFMMVQDGVCDTLDIAQMSVPGPLAAIVEFMKHHPEFSIDRERCERFLITHHPAGWLRKRLG